MAAAFLHGVVEARCSFCNCIGYDHKHSLLTQNDDTTTTSTTSTPTSRRSIETDSDNSTSITPPYRPAERVQRCSSKSNAPSFELSALYNRLCACLAWKRQCQCGSVQDACTFVTANISSSTAFSVKDSQLAALCTPLEHKPPAAALGLLIQKQSPIFGRKSLKSCRSFSLRSAAPFYARQLLTAADLLATDKKDPIDYTAVEACEMNVGVVNGGPRNATYSTDINRNNGYAKNGTIMTSINSEKREHLYKILVIGELGTGKTSFIKRYVHQFFSQNYRATIGVDFALKVLHWDANTIVRLQLWDIAGQERFGNMTRVYYKEAVGAFIVFDVTRSGTFDCVAKWKEDLDSKVQLPDGNPIPCILLANKCDQEKQGIVTSPEKMDEYVRENGFAGWFETSAKENINIDEAARALVNKILLNDKLISDADLADGEKFNLNSTDDQTSIESKKCSC